MTNNNQVASNSVPDDFDDTLYLDLNPDVKKSGVDAKTHYLMHGMNEGRQYKRNDSTTVEKILSDYLKQPPSDKNAFDLFPTSWSTEVSSETSRLNSGTFNGLDDPRIKWLTDVVPMDNTNVLELGPLEGAHSFMLEQAGATVTAIEANKGAFLRCLILKNHLSMKAKFVLGDFSQLNFGDLQYDLVVASGVLYHMEHPVELLIHLSKCTDKLFLWTHYFEPDVSKWNEVLREKIEAGKWELDDPTIVEYSDTKIRLVKQKYLDAMEWSGFCGGTETHSNWIFKDDLLALLSALGYGKLRIQFDDVAHQNGPSFCVLAER